MNDLQINCFLTVARHLSFSRAARELYISQPSVSKHVHNLERDMGVVLFDRSSSSLTLTPSGEKFRDLFLEFRTRYLSLKESLSSGKSSIIRIGFLQGSVFFEELFPIFERIHSSDPELQVEVSFHGFKSIINKLNEKEVDIIIHLEDLCGQMKDVHKVPLTKINRLVFYRKDLFPEGHSPRSLADFSEQYFLVTDDNECPDVRQSNLRLTRPFGFSPKFKTVPNIESMMWGVTHGDGVAIMDSSVSFGKSNIESLVLPESHVIMMVWPKTSGSMAVDLFTAKFLELKNMLHADLLPPDAKALLSNPR